MDIHALKQHIKSDESLIELVLEDAGFSDINGEFKHGDEYRCAWEEGSNPTAIKINKYTLSATCFSKNISGDIITLVSAKLNLPLGKTLKRIANVTKFTEEEQKEYELPFGGFFKKIHKIKKRKVTGELPILPESTLDEYLIMPSLRFLNDGITYETQIKYKIGYDLATNRIVIPWRSVDSSLVGVIGRLNKEDVDDWENKYFPLHPFSKSLTLFGLNHNYKNILDCRKCYVFESEKSTMKLDSMGIQLGVSLGGSNISRFQINQIRAMFCDEVIICMDEGLDESVSLEIAKKIKSENISNMKVGYVFDKDNTFLKKGEKESPVDGGLVKFKKLLTERVVWV